ncbi:MAG TPA: glycosyltransferase [Candidatus Gracilibacteria bacterium]|nr:glycosyltransferase [Candidatus Gracilibacteria bacterium]
MKILLTSIGSRGDMEPFLAIAEILKKRGHKVICVFPEQFRSLAEDSDFEFASLGSKFIEMLNSETGKTVMGGGYSGIRKLFAYIKLAKEFSGTNKDMLIAQKEIIEREKPDKIVRNAKAIYPLIQDLDRTPQNILISPVPYMHYVKGHPHIGFHKNYGNFINKLTFKLADFGLAATVKSSLKWVNEKKRSLKQIKNTIANSKTIYTISPTLVPKPTNWPDHLQILGFHERDKTVNWQPSSDLQNFLKFHKKILFISFGSMTNPHPAEKTKMFLDIVTKHNIPTIINCGAGGLVQPKEYNQELIHFVDRVPYDWLFPKMHAVIHHGGSGTTHMGIKNGCATMIIPHIVDQFVWNRIIAEKGAGPTGPPINTITAENLEPKILDLFNHQQYKDKAETLAHQMAQEQFQDQLCASILA